MNVTYCGISPTYTIKAFGIKLSIDIFTTFFPLKGSILPSALSKN